MIKKVSPSVNQLIIEIIKKPKRQLCDEILKSDYESKKRIIELISELKSINSKSPSEKLTNAINNLYDSLENINDLIQRMEDIREQI